MALTRVTSGAVTGLATSATTDTTDASNITTGTIPTARLASTLDLSGKTVTLPAASVTAHATNPTAVGVSSQANTANDYFALPAGSVSQRPASPTAGMLRFNTAISLLEYYDGGVWTPIDTVPSITSLDVTEVDSLLSGTQTFVVSGTGFKAGAVATFIDVNGTSFSADITTRNSATQLTITKSRASFSNANEPYDVKVTNASGLSAVLENQLNVDSAPIWVTASGSLGTFDLAANNSLTLSVTDTDGDVIGFSLISGTLPSGTSLNISTGEISGVVTGVASTYSFTIRATANGKTTDRAFSITTAASNYFGDSSDGALST